MSFLNRKSLVGNMLMGLGCVAVLAMLVAAARPFEPAAAVAATSDGNPQVAIAGR